MSSQEIRGLREQILANAVFMLQEPRPHPVSSSNTLIAQTSEPLHVIVFGEGMQYRGAVMLGTTPAIESSVSPSPEVALRRLLLATTEVIALYVPGMGAHSRNIHGGAGGVFDEDLIAPRLNDARGKTMIDG